MLPRHVLVVMRRLSDYHLQVEDSQPYFEQYGEEQEDAPRELGVIGRIGDESVIQETMQRSSSILALQYRG